MIKEFEMTEKQLEALMAACKPVPYLIANGTEPRSPQENANDVWRRLGEELGFDHMSVQPNGKGDRFFTAEVRP